MSSQNVSFFFMYAPHLWRIRTDNIQHKTIKLHLQAYYPVCYLHNSTTLSTCSFFNMISTPFFLFPLPQYHILYSPPMHLALSPFQRVSCTHSMSNPLRSIRSATSLPLPVMVLTFNVATLILIFLAFFLSSFLSFPLLHCFPPLLCIKVACPPVTLGAQSLVTVVVFPGLDRTGMKLHFTVQRALKIFSYVLRRMPFLLQLSPFIRAWDRQQGCSDLNNLRGWDIEI